MPELEQHQLHPFQWEPEWHLTQPQQVWESQYPPEKTKSDCAKQAWQHQEWQLRQEPHRLEGQGDLTTLQLPLET